MKIFADHSSRMTGPWSVGRKDAEDVQETIDDFWVKVSKGQDATKEINLLEKEFTDMISASETLKAELPQKIRNEAEKSLDKPKLLGENAQLAIDLVKANGEREHDEYDKAKRER